MLPLLLFFPFFLSFSLFNHKMQPWRDELTNDSCATRDSQVLKSIIYVDRNGTCLLDLDAGRGRGAMAGTRATVDNTVYLSRAFYGNSSGRSSRYNDRWSRYDRDRGTCALSLSATFLDSHAGAMNDDRFTGRASFKYGRIAREITIRRVRGGLREFRCHVNYCLYAVSDSN